MGLKELFLQKGWAGRTMSRQETVERLNPIIRKHYELNHAYEYVIDNISNPSLARELDHFQKLARVDIGKLAESVFSAGGAAYNGTDLEPADFDLGPEDSQMVDGLATLEGEFESMLAAELKENHQIRSRAILNVVHSNSRGRLDFVRSLARNQRKAQTA